MDARGFKIFKGFKYGGVSPKDYKGLKMWYRGTDGVTTARSTLVNGWNDLSGNGNHLRIQSGQTYAATVGNSSFGRFLQGGSTNNALVCVKPTAHKFMYDGSPMSMHIVVDLRSASISNFIGNFPASNYPQYSWTVTSNAGQRIVNRVIQNSGGTVNRDGNTGSLNYFVDNNRFMCTEVGYGYSSFTPQFGTLINGTQKASGSWLNSFPPISSITADASFSITWATTLRVYEIIIFDNTGKSKAQIDDESQKIYNEYLKKRYPNYTNIA